MLVADTNILIHAANDTANEHRICRGLIEQWHNGSVPVFIPWSVGYEFLRVITHPRVFPSPWNAQDACRFLAALLDSPMFGILHPTVRHTDVLAQTLQEFPHLRGNLVFDLHIAVLMRENGIRHICTFDAHFNRFPFLTVIKPI